MNLAENTFINSHRDNIVKQQKFKRPRKEAQEAKKRSTEKELKCRPWRNPPSLGDLENHDTISASTRRYIAESLKSPIRDTAESIEGFKKMSESDGKSSGLDKDQIAQLKEIFTSFDRNHDGSLTQLELGSLLRSLGLKPSQDEIDALIQKADTNSNGLIEFSEFAALVAPEVVPESPYSEEQLRAIFRVFDRDGNGYITAAELAHSMARLGHALTVEELTGMIKEADTDGDGRISFAEFVKAITSAAFENAWI